MVVEFLRAARHAPERWLHGVRRSSVAAAVRRRPRPASVLVVCNGNICRSPFAEAVLRRLLQPAGITVESAGLIGPGRGAPPAALQVAARRGVDLSAHRSRLVTSDLVRRADLIVVMDEAQRRAICGRFGRDGMDVLLLGDFDPEPIKARDIRDPVEQPPAVFEEVYARIGRCAAGLALSLRAT